MDNNLAGEIGWSGTLGEFVARFDAGRNSAGDGSDVAPGSDAGESSAPLLSPARRLFFSELAAVFRNSLPLTLPILVDFVTPVGNEKIDIVLISGTIEVPTLVLLVGASQKQRGEVAQFTAPIHGQNDIIQGGARAAAHLPSLVGKLGGCAGFFEGTMVCPEVAAYVWEVAELELGETSQGGPTTSGAVKDQVIFNKNDADALVALLQEKLVPVGISATQAQRLVQRTSTLPAILGYQPPGIVIGPEALESELCARGLGLSAEQDRIRREVEHAVLSREPRVFVVRCVPGSGKTLVAAALYLTGLVCRVGVGVAACGEGEYKLFRSLAVAAGAGVASVFRRSGGIPPALFPRSGKGTEFVIVDDAQFFSEADLRQLLSNGRVVVFLVDDSVAGATDTVMEAGRIVSDWLIEAAFDSGRLVSQLQLSDSRRGFNAGRFGAWAGHLLSGSATSDFLRREYQKLPVGIFPGGFFRFDICRSADEVVARLKLVRDEADRRTAVLGALQVCGQKDLDGIDRISAIEQIAGQEYDFVGIIWGQDLLFRAGRWVLGSAEACAATGDSLVIRRGKNVSWCAGALELVKARYALLLSRGVRGVFVAVEDSETWDYLHQNTTPVDTFGDSSVDGERVAREREAA